MSKAHIYRSQLVWDGNLGTGTATYAGYARDFTLSTNGKPPIHGSSDTMFRGNPSLHNPEDLFLAAISSCHMLSYLALCARKGVTIIAYEDDATASLALDASYEGKFDQVMLNPVVTVANADQAELARTLHEGAHRTCYIASSCSVPIHHNVSIRVAADS